MKKAVVTFLVLVSVVGVIYLATIGCCQVMASHARQSMPIPFSDQLKLTPDQRKELAPLEKDFLVKKRAACESLCAKRAQVIQLLKLPDPDRATLRTVVEEIGREQGDLEMATVEHLLTLRGHLDPAQREKMTDLMNEQLRTACLATSCGMTQGCSLYPKREK